MAIRLRLEQLSGWTVRRSPYVWAHFPPGSLLSADDAGELARAFPTEGLRHTVRTDADGGDKRYDNWNLDVVTRDGKVDFSTLPGAWRAFAEELLDGRYLTGMLGLLHVPDQRDIRLEMRLTEYLPATWMDPHTDRPDKVFAHTFYFTDQWHDGDGGELAILRSGCSDDVAALVPPTIGSSAAFRRSAGSWHMVRPVAARAGVRRRALLVHGYRAVLDETGPSTTTRP
ncbi:MAG TPA: 2OG-Fe(II) oxygenase [Acidimicrobiales bacterium]|nr:2OG-Fe(II) oxygenase [Acidimicrobiales bacterium]